MLAVAVMFVGFGGCSGLVRNPAADSEDDGFFGWHFHAPFDTSEVKTVAVFFKSQRFRRDLEKQLTEAVIKEINLRTPYRVVGNHEEADSMLTGMINSDDKNLVVEAPDQPAARAQRDDPVHGELDAQPADRDREQTDPDRSSPRRSTSSPKSAKRR